MKPVLLFAVAAAALLPGANAELEACLEALGQLTTAPYSYALPFLNGGTGHVNLAYLYQKPMFAVMPNEAMGNFDFCRHAEIYTPGSLVKTHYCSLTHDRGGVCVPEACEAQDLHNLAILPPLVGLGTQAAAAVPTECLMDPYLSRECAAARQGWEYFQTLYNNLAALGQDTPYSHGSVSCGVHGQEADTGAYFMMYLTLVLAVLAVGGAAWTYLYSQGKAARKKRDDSRKHREVAAAALPLPSPGFQPVAVTVAQSPGKPQAAGGFEFKEISLQEDKDRQPAASTPRSRLNPSTPNSSRGAPPPRLAPRKSSSSAVVLAAEEPDMFESVAGALDGRLPSCPKPLAAFSLTENWAEVFTVKRRPGEFAVFDGMKAISAAWVVFYHVLLWQIYFVQNPEYLIPPKGLLAKTWAAPFFNYSGTLSVDTFFFISGFLAVYFLMLKLDKEERANKARPPSRWIPALYLHRWMRITPAYAFAFFLHWKLAPIMSYGPLAATVWESNTAPCRNVWWAHFLYINDIYPWWNQRLGEVCYGHSWYLANDMQYFLLVPFVAAGYRSGKPHLRKAAKYFVWACLLVCILTSWILTIKDDWSPISWDGVQGDHYREQGFSRPWTRCSSYMIGILFAFAWYDKKTNSPDYKFNKVQSNLLWIAGLGLLAIAMYGPHTGSVNVIPCNIAPPGTKCGSPWSPTTKAAVIALLRPTWTLGLGCLSVLCWNNQGGLIQKFLASGWWHPLNTLSFCIYLVHYTVLTYWISQRTLRIRFELFSFVTVFLGLMAVSCAVALLVVLLVEKPFMKLQKLYFETPKGPTAAERRRAAQLAARNKALPTSPPTKMIVELVAPAKGSAEALCTCGVE